MHSHLPPESTLTLDNLTGVLDDISDANLVAAWLAITDLQQMDIIVSCRDNPSQIKRAYWESFLAHHPAPCWKIVAVGPVAYKRVWNIGESAEKISQM